MFTKNGPNYKWNNDHLKAHGLVGLCGKCFVFLRFLNSPRYFISYYLFFIGIIFWVKQKDNLELFTFSPLMSAQNSCTADQTVHTEQNEEKEKQRGRNQHQRAKWCSSSAKYSQTSELQCLLRACVDTALKVGAFEQCGRGNHIIFSLTSLQGVHTLNKNWDKNAP